MVSVLINTITNNMTPGTYDFTWTPPTVATTKTLCKVRVGLRSATNTILAPDTSDAVFTIIP